MNQDIKELINTLKLYLERPSTDGKQPVRIDLRNKLSELIKQIESNETI